MAKGKGSTGATTPKPPKEREIQKQILEYLNLIGWSAWRFNSGATKTPGGGFVRFNTARGCSDVIGIIPGGWFLAIEVKRPGNKPTPLQQAWLDEVREAGGLALVAVSVDDLRTQLRKAGHACP